MGHGCSVHAQSNVPVTCEYSKSNPLVSIFVKPLYRSENMAHSTICKGGCILIIDFLVSKSVKPATFFLI